jgi:3',5'-cyclic AMP phosphodiesterase CpdA
VASLYSLAQLEVKAQTSFTPFSFGVVSDVHLITGSADNYKMLQESQLFLQDCIKTLNSQKLDFVIFLGNQVETPGDDDRNWQLFLDVAQTLNCPWSFVLGNSDISGASLVDKMHSYGPDWKHNGIDTNKPYWSHDPLPNVHLIGLDTSSANTSIGNVDNEQLQWLTNDLRTNKEKFSIVFSHHPLLPPTPFDRGGSWDQFVLPQAPQVRDILEHSNARLAFSGHTHVSKILEREHLYYISCPSLDVFPCAFRTIRVSPEEITVSTYRVSYPALIKKALNALAESDFSCNYNPKHPQAFAEVARGSAADQNAVLKLGAGKQNNR